MARPRKDAEGKAELTFRQSAFIKFYAAGNSAALAARKAGYGKEMSLRAAQKVLSSPAVRAAVEDARAQLQKATLYDAERAFADLQEAVEFAKEHKSPMAVVRSYELMAKLAGLMVDRVQIESIDLAGAMAEARKRSPLREPITIDQAESERMTG